MAKSFLDLSTAGMKVAYAIETTANTKPTAFINIPNPKSIPDFNPEPNKLDTTSLNQTSYKTSIEGLKDAGSSISIKFGMSQGFVEMWNTDIVAAYKLADASGKRLWFEFYHPNMEQAFFCTAQASELGFPSADVDSVWDGNASIIPTGEIGWATAIAPTDPSLS